MALMFIVMRYLNKLNSVMLVHYQVIGGIIVGPIGMIMDPQSLFIPNLFEIVLIVLSAFIEASLLYFIARALKYETAGKISLFFFNHSNFNFKKKDIKLLPNFIRLHWWHPAISWGNKSTECNWFLFSFSFS